VPFLKYLSKERLSEEPRYNLQMLREELQDNVVITEFEIESLSSNFLISCLNESALYCIIQLHWHIIKSCYYAEGLGFVAILK
jgi:hypothetical protein